MDDARQRAEKAIERMGFSPNSTAGQWMVGIVADAVDQAVRAAEGVVAAARRAADDKTSMAWWADLDRAINAYDEALRREPPATGGQG